MPNKNNKNKNKNGNGKPRGKQNRLIKKFLLIAAPVPLVYLIGAFIVTQSLIAQVNKPYSMQNLPPSFSDSEKTTQGPGSVTHGSGTDALDDFYGGDDGSLLRPPARTNILIYGIDENNLTDVMMVASFIRDTAELKILSIPRDLYTKQTDEQRERWRQVTGRNPPPREFKINNLRSYGQDYGVLLLQEHLSSLLGGITIDYYIELRPKGFISLVDLLGGVDLEVPGDGLFYKDPVQNLEIAIPPGMQHFDGAKAEGLVRFRQYRDGDADRVSVQQQFMMQLFRQALNRDFIMSNPLGIAEFALTNIQTDMSIAEIARYVPYADRLTSNSIKTYTLPGKGDYVGATSYYLPNKNQIPEMVNEIFFGIESNENARIPDEDAPSRGANIAIYNGSDISGLATSLEHTLTEDGYTVAHVSHYNGTREQRTRILVNDDKYGADLQKYFTNSIVRKDTGNTTAYDIVIIIGRSER